MVSQSCHGCISGFVTKLKMNQQTDLPAPHYVTCPCQHCGGKIEFDANQLNPLENTTVPCPHCELETTIFVPKQKVPPILSHEDFHLSQISEVELEEKQLSKPPANFGRIGEDEEIIQQCIKVIRSKKEASASLLNKQLRLGYNRAAQILDELAKRGIVGPFKYADAPRHILIDLNDGGYLRGDAKWQTDLGIAYFRQKDYLDAVKCFLVAAKQGYANAQCLLGNCYKDGWGVEKNEAEAVKWYSTAAEHGQPHAIQPGCRLFLWTRCSKQFFWCAPMVARGSRTWRR